MRTIYRQKSVQNLLGDVMDLNEADMFSLFVGHWFELFSLEFHLFFITSICICPRPAL